MKKKLPPFSRQTLRMWLAWAVYFSIGICLIYSSFYLAVSYLGFSSGQGTLFSGSGDLIVWGSTLFIIFAWFFFDVFKGVLDEFYGYSKGLILSLILVGLFALECFILVGILNPVMLSLVSAFMIALSFVFCQNILGVSRFGLTWRLILTALIALAILALTLWLI